MAAAAGSALGAGTASLIEILASLALIAISLGIKRAESFCSLRICLDFVLALALRVIFRFNWPGQRFLSRERSGQGFAVS